MSKCFLVVSSDSQWKWAVQEGAVRANDVVVSGNYAVLRGARKRQLRTIDLWTYVNGHSQRINLEKAHKICHDIWKKQHIDYTKDGVDYLKCFVFDLMCPIWSVLNTWDALEAFIKERRGGIRCFKSHGRYYLWDPPQPPPDLFDECVNRVAIQHGWPVDLIDTQPEEGASDRRVDAEVNYRVSFPSEISPEIDFLSVCGDISTSEQASLFRYMTESLSERFLVVADELGEGVQSLQRSELFKMPFCRVEFSNSLLEALCTDLQTACNGVFENLQSCISAWFRQLAVVGSCAELLACGYRPAACVLGYDVIGENRITAQVMKRNGVEIVSVDHVGLPVWSDQYRYSLVEADVAVWGPFGAACQKACGRAGNVFRVGCLRNDIANAVVTHSVRTIEKNIFDCLFITSSVVAECMCGGVRPEELVKSWTRTVRLFCEHDDWRLSIKPHPRYDMTDFYQQEVISALDNGRLLSEPLENILPSMDVAVLYNTPSTSIMHVVEAGIPVIYMKDVIFGEMNSVIDCDDILQARDHAELRDLIIRIQDPLFRADVLMKQELFRKQALVAKGQQAARNMWHVLEQYPKQERAVIPEYRWLLDVVAWILRTPDSCIGDDVSRSEHFSRISCIAVDRGFDASVLNLLVDVQRLPVWLFNKLIHCFERSPHINTRMYARWAVWVLYHELPCSLRPSWRKMRCFIIRAIKLKIGMHELSAFDRMLLCLFAPGFTGKYIRNAGLVPMNREEGSAE